MGIPKEIPMGISMRLRKGIPRGFRTDSEGILRGFEKFPRRFEGDSEKVPRRFRTQHPSGFRGGTPN
eukprot:15458036-Alexandrium_andersonii.AAC.1